MAVEATREEQYIRALMVLGPIPREPKRIGPGSAARSVPEEVEAYKRATEYNDAVQNYWIRHIFAPGNDIGIPDWIEGFYNWQKEYQRECS